LPSPLVSEDRSAAGVFVPAILAGLAAAIAGGIAWGLIVKLTDYEIGFAAWGIGFVTGIAILTVTRGARGLPFQAIAIGCALLGIVVGKYLGFVWGLQEAAEDADVEFSLPIFSSDTVSLFFDERGEVFGLFDLLWVGFAVYSAWRTLQPEQPEPVEGSESPEDRPQAGPGP
jgi:hypothetical protein